MPYEIELPDGSVVGDIPDTVPPEQAKERIRLRFPEVIRADYPPVDVEKGSLASYGTTAAGTIQGLPSRLAARYYGTRYALEAAPTDYSIIESMEVPPETMEKLSQGWYGKDLPTLKAEHDVQQQKAAEYRRAEITARAKARGYLPKEMTGLQEFTSDVVGNIVENVPAFVAARFGLPALGAAYTGAQVFGEAAARGAEEGLSREQIAQVGVPTTAAEYIGERIGLGFITKAFQDPTLALRRKIAYTMASEFGTEGVTESVQSIFENLTFNPDMPWEKLVAESVKAGLYGGAVGAVSGGVLTGGIGLVDKAIDKYKGKTAKQVAEELTPTPFQEFMRTGFDLTSREKAIDGLRQMGIPVDEEAESTAIAQARKESLDKLLGGVTEGSSAQKLPAEDLAAATESGGLETLPNAEEVFAKLEALKAEVAALNEEELKAAQEAEVEIAKVPEGKDEPDFTTEKGSGYTLHPDGTTSRNKAARPEHPGDFGPQPRSEHTFYVDEQGLQALGEFQAVTPQAKRIVVLPSGEVGIQYADGTVERRTVVTPFPAPAVGLYPVELFKEGSSVHFGNKIVATKSPPPDLTIEERSSDAYIVQSEKDLVEAANEGRIAAAQRTADPEAALTKYAQSAQARRAADHPNNLKPPSELPVSIARDQGLVGRRYRAKDHKNGEVIVVGEPDVDLEQGTTTPEDFSFFPRKAYVEPLVQTIQQMVDKYAPNARIVILLKPAGASKSGFHHFASTGVHFIRPRMFSKFEQGQNKAEYNRNWQSSVYFTALHEMAHVLTYERLYEGVPVQLQKQIRIFSDRFDPNKGEYGLIPEEIIAQVPANVQPLMREYNKLKERIGSGQMRAVDLINTWFSPAKRGNRSYWRDNFRVDLESDAFQAMSAKDLALIMTVKDPEARYFSFEEYIAEQLPIYAYAKKSYLQDPLGQQLKTALNGLLDYLRDLFRWAKIHGIVKPGVQFAKWLEGLTATPAVNVDEMNAKKALVAEELRAAEETADEELQLAPEVNKRGEGTTEKDIRGALIRGGWKPSDPEYKEIIKLYKEGAIDEALVMLEELLGSGKAFSPEEKITKPVAVAKHAEQLADATLMIVQEISEKPKLLWSSLRAQLARQDMPQIEKDTVVRTAQEAFGVNLKGTDPLPGAVNTQVFMTALQERVPVLTSTEDPGWANYGLSYLQEALPSVSLRSMRSLVLEGPDKYTSNHFSQYENYYAHTRQVLVKIEPVRVTDASPEASLMRSLLWQRSAALRQGMEPPAPPEDFRTQFETYAAGMSMADALYQQTLPLVIEVQADLIQNLRPLDEEELAALNMELEAAKENIEAAQTALAQGPSSGGLYTVSATSNNPEHTIAYAQLSSFLQRTEASEAELRNKIARGTDMERMKQAYPYGWATRNTGLLRTLLENRRYMAGRGFPAVYFAGPDLVAITEGWTRYSTPDTPHKTFPFSILPGKVKTQFGRGRASQFLDWYDYVLQLSFAIGDQLYFDPTEENKQRWSGPASVSLQSEQEKPWYHRKEHYGTFSVTLPPDAPGTVSFRSHSEQVAREIPLDELLKQNGSSEEKLREAFAKLPYNTDQVERDIERLRKKKPHHPALRYMQRHKEALQRGEILPPTQRMTFTDYISGYMFYEEQVVPFLVNALGATKETLDGFDVYRVELSPALATNPVVAYPTGKKRINFNKEYEDLAEYLSDFGIDPVTTAGLTEEDAMRPEVQARAAGLWEKHGPRSPFFKAKFGDWENPEKRAIPVYDREGNVLRTQDFPAGATTVLDARGRPLEVLHGTGARVVAFSPMRRGSATNASSAFLGFYAAGKRATAQFFAELASEPAPMTQEAFKAVEARRRIMDMLWRKEDRLNAALAPVNLAFLQQHRADPTAPNEADVRRKELQREIERTVEKTHGHLRAIHAIQNNPASYESIGPQVIPLYLDIRNPYIVDMEGRSAAQTRISPLVQLAKERGHDGLIIRNFVDGPVRDTQYVFFKANQAKWGEGKNVTFSKGKRLNYSLDLSDLLELNAEEVADRAEAVVKSSPIRRALLRFLRWQYSALQMQQLAHIHPDITGLQFMRQHDSDYSRDRAFLQSSPSEGLTQMRMLNKEAIGHLHKMLLAEAQGGVHWAALVPDAKGNFTFQMTEEVLTKARQFHINPDTHIGKETLKAYLRTKQAILDQQQFLGLVLSGQIFTRYSKDPAKADQVARRSYSRFIEYYRKPFVPQQWFGEHGFTIKRKVDGKWTLVHKEAYENLDDFFKRVAEVEKKLKPDEKLEHFHLTDREYVVMALPLEFLEDAVRELELTKEEAEKLQELLVPLKEDKALKRYDPRWQITGASEEYDRVFSSFTWHQANFIAKMKYRSLFRSDINQVRKQIKTMHEAEGIAPMARAMQILRLHDTKNFMQRTFDYGMSPPNEMQNARALISALYLAYNVKTFLLNFYGLVTTWSSLLSEFGPIKGHTILIRSAYDALNSVMHGDEVLREKPGLMAAIEMGIKQQVLHQSYAHHLAGQAIGGWLYRKFSRYPMYSILSRAVEFGMVPFRLTELGARRITFVAKYEAGLQRRGLPPNAPRDHDSYIEAVEQTNILMGNYSAMNRPAFMRGLRVPPGAPKFHQILGAAGPLATIFMTFTQTIAFHTYGGYELGQRRRARMKGDTPRGIFMGYTMKIWLLTLLVAGLKGLPGFENLFDVLNWIWKAFFGKASMEKDLREFFKGIGMDPAMAMYGLSHDVMGFDISRSVGFGRIVPGTDALANESKSTTEMFGAIAFGFLGPTGSFLRATLSYAEDPSLESFSKMPGVLGNVGKTLDWATHGVTGPRGGTITFDKELGQVRDLTPKELIGQAIGFRPTIVSTAKEVAFEQYDFQLYWSKRRGDVLSAVADAILVEDREAEADAYRAVEEFNAEAPEEYPELQITAKEYRRGIKKRLQDAEKEEAQMPQNKRFTVPFEDIRSTH